MDVVVSETYQTKEFYNFNKYLVLLLHVSYLNRGLKVKSNIYLKWHNAKASLYASPSLWFVVNGGTSGLLGDLGIPAFLGSCEEQLLLLMTVQHLLGLNPSVFLKALKTTLP